MGYQKVDRVQLYVSLVQTIIIRKENQQLKFDRGITSVWAAYGKLRSVITMNLVMKMKTQRNICIRKNQSSGHKSTNSKTERRKSKEKLDGHNRAEAMT